MLELTIGELLRRHRLDASLTQKQLADLLPYDHTTISRIERNERLPTEDYLSHFAETLHLTDAQLQEMMAAFHGSDGEQISYPAIPTRREDWGEAPDVSAFYGRYEDLVTLTQWLADNNCRLIVLLGMGGIGKTALATKLARQTADKFEYVIWRSLRNAPPLRELLTECIQFLSDRQEIDLPERTDKVITRLIDYLAAQRCLVVLDNAESILQEGHAGHYRPEYEDYGRLIQRLGESRHISCVIITSREKPREVGLLEGEDASVRSHPLTGLQIEEGRQILAGKRLTGSNEAWDALVQHYSGNPLALNIVAEMIREVYDGNIDDFLTDEAIIFGRIGDVLGEQFARLSVLEQSLMYWLAIEREPVSREILLDNLIEPVTKRELILALRSLRRRSLVEQSGAEFTLQNVVMEYVTERLIEQIYEEITSDTIVALGHFTLTKALTKAYIRTSQQRLILRPIVDKLQKLFSRIEVIEKIQKLLGIMQDRQSRILDYCAGNLISLLNSLSVDLKGYNLSRLTIRQASLQEVDLQDVNFSFANFDKCTFLEPLSSIYALAFHPSGSVLAAGTTSGEIRLWQIRNNKPLMTLKGHNDWVRSVTFSPDGSILASSSDDQTIRLWDTVSGHCINLLREHESWVRWVTFNPTGDLLASCSDDCSIRLWDVKSGKCIKRLTGSLTSVRSVAFTPDGKSLVSGSEDRMIRVWDIEKAKCIKEVVGHEGWIRSVALHPKGSQLASSGEDKIIRLWDLATFTCIQSFSGHTNLVRSITYSQDGSLLVSVSEDRTARVWDVESGQCLHIFQTENTWTKSMALSPRMDILATGGDDHAIRLWDIYDGHCLQVIKGHANAVSVVSFSPNGQLLVSGNGDNTIRFWDVESSDCINTIRAHDSWIWDVAFSPCGNILASCSEDQTVKLWNVKSGNLIRIIDEHPNGVGTVTFHPNGKVLASAGGDQTIRLWDIENGNCIQILRGHSNGVSFVTFNTEGNILISSSEDKTIRIWDIENFTCLKVLTGHQGWVWDVSLSKNSLLASSSEDKTVRLWDINKAECIQILKGHTDCAWTVAFNPEGTLLASGGRDGIVMIWNPINGQCIRVLDGHLRRVRRVVFSPNGQTLVSSSDDETIRFWNVNTGKCINILRNDRPYERMNITGVTGLTEAQKASLKALGAIDENHP